MPVNQELYRDLYKNARMIVILKLIFDLGGSATEMHLCKILGVHHEGVTNNLHRLSLRNLIQRPNINGGWFLTKLGMKFVVAENPQLPPITTTTLNIEESVELEVEVDSLVAENPQQVHTIRAGKAAENPQLPEEVWKAFYEIGITHNPTTNQVSLTPGLTYEGVIKQWQELKSHGKPWRGLLIQIIPTLQPWELRGHSQHCQCTACYEDHARQHRLEDERKRKRYGEWNNAK